MEQRLKAVDVIAVCRADGTIQPLRLRLERRPRRTVPMQQRRAGAVPPQVFRAHA